MKESVRRVKDDYVIFRYNEEDKDWLKNDRSEYWTWSEWKIWLKRAKLYWTEDDAAQALIKIRLLSKKGVW